MDRQADRIKALFATQGEMPKLTDEINKTLTITGYLAHQVEIIDSNTGEATKAIRLVVFTKDGGMLSCVSNTLLESFQRLVWAFGTPSEEKPFKVVVKSQMKKSDRRIFWFEPVK